MNAPSSYAAYLIIMCLLRIPRWTLIGMGVYSRQLSGNWHQRMRKHHGTEKSTEHAMCRCEKSAWSFHRLSACHVMKIK